ncbi:MAG: hypothetical protein ACOX81_02495 [Candidatus Heteroscillospira sp.]|jgi:hypothetical protein
MRFFLCALKTELYELLRGGRRLAMLCAAVLCLTLAARLMPEAEVLPAVPVGWVMPENCERGAELLEILREREGIVSFIPTDEDSLRRNVASGKWECGFILREDFDKRVEKQRWPRLFTLVRGESSTVDALVSEAVSAAMLVMVSPEIGEDYLKEKGVPAPEEGWILEESLRMEIEPVYNGLEGIAPAAGLGRDFIRGGAGALMLLLSLAMGDSLSRRRCEPWFMRAAAVQGENALLLPALCARFILLLCASALVLDIRFIVLLSFCLCLTALMYLLARLPGGWSALLLPFLPPVLLVLCPVLFDVSELFPVLRPLCALIPLTHLLRGDTLPNIILAAMFALAGKFVRRRT